MGTAVGKFTFIPVCVIINLYQPKDDMFYLVNTETGQRHRRQTDYDYVSYETETGAKIALSSLKKRHGNVGQWKIQSSEAWLLDHPVTMVQKRNALTGELFYESSDTPFCCSPSSESYWAN
jgi:hypothetical protein